MATRSTLSKQFAPASLTLTPGKSALALLIGAACAFTAGFLAPPDLIAPGCILAFGLAWATMIDADRFILPDVLTLGLVVAGLLVALTRGISAAQPYILGAIAGYLALASIAWLYRRLRRRNGLGLGDAKLLAAGGAWVGWTGLPFIVLFASAICLASLLAIAIWKRRRISSGPVAFGPFLAAGIWIVWLVQATGQA